MPVRVAHIAIAVADLEPAVELWSRLLELIPGPTEELPNQGVRSVGFHLENLVIELVSPLEAGSPIANFLAKRGPGLHHIAFHTDDLATTLAAKQDQGFQIIPPREGPGAGGMQVTFLHPKSMAGTLVEFVQPAMSEAERLAEEHLLAGGHPVSEHTRRDPVPEGP